MNRARNPPPGVRVAGACERHGTAAVVRAATALLEGAPHGEVAVGVDEIGGFPSYLEESGAQYWSRVWGARALRYAWVEGGETGRAAEAALVAGLHDEHWRVREMCAEVAALHELGAAGDRLATLLGDPTPRVRAAAAAALGVVGEHEHLEPLRDATDDPDHAVVRATQRALEEMTARLDLPHP